MWWVNSDVASIFSQCNLLIPPENFRKPLGNQEGMWGRDMLKFYTCTYIEMKSFEQFGFKICPTFLNWGKTFNKTSFISCLVKTVANCFKTLSCHRKTTIDCFESTQIIMPDWRCLTITFVLIFLHSDLVQHRMWKLARRLLFVTLPLTQDLTL